MKYHIQLYFRKAMEFYRGSFAPGLDEELNAIVESTSIRDSKKGFKCSTLRQLTTASFLKPFLCIGVLRISYHVSGYTAVCAYSNDYFENAGAQALSYAADSAILGTVKLILSLLAPLILSRASKKILFATFGFVSAVAFILGNNCSKTHVCVIQFRRILNMNDIDVSFHNLLQWRYVAI